MRMGFCLILVLILVGGVNSLTSKELSRRRVLVGTASFASFWVSSPQIGNAVSNNLQAKLEQDTLTLPAPSYASELNGVDNTYFPSFLEGDWKCTQTLVDTKTPLGLVFLGGPNGDLDVARTSMDQARKQVGKPISLSLRYIKTKWGVAEDRLFNSRERLNAFADKDVVSNVFYADVGGSNRKSVLLLGGTELDPLQTSVVYFKGPAAQKSFVTSHASEIVGEGEKSSYIISETQRSIFALTNSNTSPPITTDTEYIWKFDPIDESHVKVKLRIAGYLNAQNDKLYFEARNRAVSLQDYTIDMTKVK